jgi:hypothetical protein
MNKSLFLILAAAGTLTASVSAGTINISPIAGGLTLRSGDLSSTVFAGSKPAWSDASLASAHAALNAAGIATDGKVTILPADTDHGLALLVLIDREIAPVAPIANGHLHMDTVGAGSNLAYINDVSDAINITAGGGPSSFASADFVWNSNGGGDGFAWANLVTGNNMTFRFQRPSAGDLGLIDPATFQFVTWTASGWQLVAIPTNLATFSDTGEFSFSAIVAVPLPTSVGLAGMPLLGMALIRRRRA